MFAMMGVAYICYWTGVLLIECLYENDKKVRFSYREVSCVPSGATRDVVELPMEMSPILGGRVLSSRFRQMGAGRTAHRAALHMHHLPGAGGRPASELFPEHR